MASNSKGFFTASVIFSIIIVVVIGVSAFLSPGPLLFSDNFEDATRNKQCTVCPGFSIAEERLRVTVEDPYMGRAITLPYAYEEFVFTLYVYPVGDVKDSTINILFGQADGRAYEIQYRPDKEQINHTETETKANQEKVVTFTTGWQSVKGTPFNSANKIKLVVTRRSFDFWVNGFRILQVRRTFDNNQLNGQISIGAGAGETGGIVFDFDNIEIRKLMPLNRRLHDYLVQKELEKNKSTPSQNGLCLECEMPLLGLAFSQK